MNQQIGLLSFLKILLKNPKLLKLRIFTSWVVICSIPTTYVVLITLKSQTFIPGTYNDWSLTNYLFQMWSGIFVVPLLFTLTNGLRGYHILFSKILGNLGYFFVPKSQEELAEELGPLLPEKVMQMEQSATILGFLTLEFIIIGWDVVVYILNNMSGLSLLGFLSDNLLIGAFIFILEACNVVVVGSKSFLQLHTLKLTKVIKSDKNQEAEEIEESSKSLE